MSIPQLCETESIPLLGKTVFEHWVLPAVNFHWLIVEFDPKERMAFGYAFLNNAQNAEWGYINIRELEKVGAIKVQGFKPKVAVEAIKEVSKEVKTC